MLWGLCWAQTWIMSLEIVIKAQTLEIESTQLTPQLARERERERHPNPWDKGEGCLENQGSCTAEKHVKKVIKHVTKELS